jgi:hypothetical protein
LSKIKEGKMDKLNWKDRTGKCEYCNKIGKRFNEIGKITRYYCKVCNVSTIKIADVKRDGLQITYANDMIKISFIDRD